MAITETRQYREPFVEAAGLGVTNEGLRLLKQALPTQTYTGRSFVAGAGRSKLVSSFLAMRLVHCGYQVNMVGEIVTPALQEGDLYIVISGSGGTKTLLPTLETAKSKGAKIAIVSMKSSSAMADLAVKNIDEFFKTGKCKNVVN